MPSEGTPTRRQLLAGAGTTIGALALAGCTSSDGDNPDESGTSQSGAKAGPDDSGGDEQDDSGGETDTGCPDESVHSSYEETEIRITDGGGDPLGSVTAAIADTDSTRYLGLSDTNCLPSDRGMLFVYQEPQSLTFVMRDMEFGLDIVYIGEDGVITSIQHAGPPAEGESGEEQKHQYPGEGQFVLEVNRGWTTARGIEAGDSVSFEL